MPRIKSLLFLWIALLTAGAAAQPPGPAPPAAAPQNREADHEELRRMLRTAVEAMNARNFDALAPLFYNKVSITTVDNRHFTTFDGFKSYYQNLLSGPQAPLKSITFNPTPDELTDFVGDNIGVSYGKSTDTFNFTDGDTRTMNSRWTATLVKDGGRWKILTLHMGTNLLDNPVTEAARGYVYRAGAIAGVIGLLLGFLIAWLIRGRARTA